MILDTPTGLLARGLQVTLSVIKRIAWQLTLLMAESGMTMNAALTSETLTHFASSGELVILVEWTCAVRWRIYVSLEQEPSPRRKL